MKKLLMLLLAACAAPAFACSALPPEAGFVMQADDNQDGGLSRREFAAVKNAGNYRVQFALAPSAFAALDQNRNGILTHEELEGKVAYVRHPCADWEEMMERMSAQSRAVVRIFELVVAPANVAEFERLGRQNIAASVKNEPGVLAMYVLTDKEMPNKFYVVEAYADEAAYQAHRQSAHFQVWLDGTKNMIVSRKMTETASLVFGSKTVEAVE